MPFPFYWIGAIVAALFLTSVLTVFGIALRLLTRTSTEVRASILPGLVSGLRSWTRDGREAARRLVSPRSVDTGATMEETSGPSGAAVEAVRPHLR